MTVLPSLRDGCQWGRFLGLGAHIGPWFQAPISSIGLQFGIPEYGDAVLAPGEIRPEQYLPEREEALADELVRIQNLLIDAGVIPNDGSVSTLEGVKLLIARSKP